MEFVPIIAKIGFGVPVSNVRLLWAVMEKKPSVDDSSDEVPQKLDSGYIKKKQPIEKFTLVHSLRALYKMDPLCLWRGFGMSLFLNSVHNLTYAHLADYVDLMYESISPVPYLAMHSASISVAQFLWSPVDVLKTRIVCQPINPVLSQSWWLTATKLYSEIGFAGFFWSPLAFANFLSYTTTAFVENFRNLALVSLIGEEPAALVHFVADFAWDLLTLAVTMPLQTIQWRMHLNGVQSKQDAIVPLASHPNYTSLLDCAQKTLQENNGNILDAFYRGISSRVWGQFSRRLGFLLVRSLAVPDDEYYE